MNDDEIRDAARWAALIFLHPVDLATVAMGAKDGKEMQAELAKRADAFIGRAKAAYAKHLVQQSSAIKQPGMTHKELAHLQGAPADAAGESVK